LAACNHLIHQTNDLRLAAGGPVKTIFRPLFVVLAYLTDPVVARVLKDVVRQLQFANAQNEQLRDRLPERIVLTPRERRRLIRLGKPLGSAVKDLITIVSPATFQRWLREEKAGRARPAGADASTSAS
jgi:putative transposase